MPTGRHLQVVTENTPMSKHARPLADDRLPWERQPMEGTKPWEAFQMYRNMGKNRSTLAVARALGKSATLIHRWSGKWQWNARAYEYELEIDRVAMDAAKREVGEMAKRHAQNAQLVLTALTTPSMALVRKIQNDPQFFDRMLQSAEVTVNGVTRLDVGKTMEMLKVIKEFASAIPAIASVERLARGEPTEITKTEATNTNTNTASHDLARSVIADPETAALAAQLFERIEGQI